MKKRTTRTLGYGETEPSSMEKPRPPLEYGVAVLAVGRESRSVTNTRVVLLDQKVLKVDGLDALEWIKRPGPMKTMLTSSREERDLLRSNDLGTNTYVVKPISFKDFIEVVKKGGLFWETINQSLGTTEWKA